MDNLHLRLAFAGPRTDEEQRAADASQSLLHGLECREASAGHAVVVDDGSSNAVAGGDEHDSLFGGGDDGVDVDMESLFGDETRSDQQQQQQQIQPIQQPPALPLPCPLTLPLLPLLPPLVPDMSGSTCDVNEQQQHGQPDEQHRDRDLDLGLENGLALPGPGFDDAMLGLGFNFDFEMDFGLAVELAVAQEAQNTQNAQNTQSGQPHPSGVPHLPLSPTTFFTATAPTLHAAAIDDQQPLSLLQMQAPLATATAPGPDIDSLSPATGLGSHDDQEGHERSALGGSENAIDITNVDDSDGDDSDVVIVSSRQVTPGFVLTPPEMPASTTPTAPAAPAAPAAPTQSIPHYLELRPRCPQGPPPARIDLSHNVEELLPHVQLYSKLSMRGIQDLLGLDADVGRYLVTTCQRHLADPAHTVRPSGSSDPAALRVLKVTLIHSSLALLVGGNVGQRWFGADAPTEPKSPHVWPDDSTTLTLLFIQLLYRLTRNNNARERHRRRSAAAAAASATASATASAAASPASTSVAGNDGSPPPAATTVESCASPPQPELPTPATSPQSLSPKALQAQPRKRKRKPKATASTAAVPQLALPSSALPARPLFSYSSPRVVRENLLSSGANNTAAAPPADAHFRYRINIVDGVPQERAIPQVVLAHEGAVRDAGYSYIVHMCAQLGQAVSSVSIVTLAGLERISCDLGWDQVVGQTYNHLLMDSEIRVLVCLQ
ncbi:hypothetical protein SCUCBS95973_007458 [Sporothrix curviconia]|uniref:Uncharacterized protein n=1 Tax=Sporothrix curviconia TaxID=1260050 RepID=A0ABP0CG77_9PEZI